VNSSGLRPTKHESCRGLFTDSVDHLTSFPASTRTPVFGNDSNCYDHLKTADVRSFADCHKTASLMASKLGFEFRINENYDFFMIDDLLIGLGSLMIYTHDITILTKTKEMIRYCESFGYGGKMISTHVSIILMKVSVPAEDG
jgi:hypothetical protein